MQTCGSVTLYKLRISNIPKVQYSEGPKFRRFKIPKVQNSEGPKVQKSEGSKIRRVKSPKVQKSEGSKVRRLKSPKFPWVIGGGGGGGGGGLWRVHHRNNVFHSQVLFNFKSKEFNETQQTTTCYKTFLFGLSENVTHKTFQEYF